MADVNWNLAVTPDPFKQIAEGANYSKQIFDQAALLKAGSQYAAGDPASAANTVASRGDFATAGKLQDLGTARTAGAQYAAGDPGAAAKTYATAGDFESAQKLQDYDIKKITAQQELFQQAVPYLDDAITQGHDPGATFDIIAPLMKGRGVPDQTIAQTRASFIANPKATIGALSALAKAQWLKAGDDQVLVDGTGKERARIKGGEDSLFGNATDGRALNIVSKGPGTPGYDLAKAYLERQTGQVAQTPSGPLFIQGPRFTVPGQPGQGNQPAPPPPGGGTPAPGTSTRVGDRMVTPLTPGQTKPMPVGVQKAEDEDLDAISTATNINNDLKPFQDQLKAGKMTLGPVANTISNVENYIGQSTEGSRNYGDFRAALEKLRNDSLRLNKGVQTEGDAVRAWNELFNNLNDNTFVAQRLEQIRGINARAAQIRTQNVNIRRQRNNWPAFDWTGFKIPDSPYETAPLTGATEGGNPLAEARDAIARGAPRAAVIQRLRQSGVKFNPGDL